MMSEKQQILIVDDNKGTVQILNELLQNDYSVRFATNGVEALQMASSAESPDLILLDVMMPEMHGYEVCHRLKADNKTSSIPVIFITVLSEIENETRGFALGAVDFITKPFNPDIVRARVATHLALRKTRLDLMELVEKTLAESIKVLVDMLAISRPAVFCRANRLKGYMHSVVEHLQLPDAWKFDLAATLSHIGCITTPDDILYRAYSDQEFLPPEEKKAFLAHPEVGRSLLQKIPRMEVVAEIIGRQLDPPLGSLDLTTVSELDTVDLGVTLLSAIMTFDLLTSQGKSKAAALGEMRKRKLACNDVIGLLATSIDFVTLGKVYKEVNASQLVQSMLIDEDIYNDKDVLLIKKGSEVTFPVMKVLQRYAELEKIKEPIRVLARK